jgi:hypothetical protein
MLNLDSILNEAKEKIIRCYDPLAILLGGSFARNEATSFGMNSEHTIISDLEIFVITKKYFKRNCLHKIQQELSNKYRIEIYITPIKPSRLIYNQVRNLALGRALPSIFMYELKNGSRVIYKRENLNFGIEMDSTKIPLYEGIILILNRMAETISLTSIKRNYFLDKLLIAVGDALLLHSHKYHYSYRERLRRLKEIGDKYKNLLNVLVLVGAYERKIKGSVIEYSSPMIYEIFEMVIRILSFLCRREFGFSFDDSLGFASAYLAFMRTCRRKYCFYNLGKICNPYFENFIYFLKLKSKNVKVPGTFLKKMNISWHHIIYGFTPLIFEKVVVGRHEKEITAYLSNYFPELNNSEYFVSLWQSICVGF